MHGEIIIADLLAQEAARKSQGQGIYSPASAQPKTPVQGRWEILRDEEGLQDWLGRQHLSSLHRAYEEFGAANSVESERDRDIAVARVRKRWGQTLEEAFERKAKYRKWLEREYMPRAAAWHRRMGSRPSV